MNSSKSTLIYKIFRIPFCYLSKGELYLKLFPVIGKNTNKLVDKITELNPEMIFLKNDTPGRVVFFIGKYKYSTIPRGGINSEISDTVEIYPNLYKSKIYFNYQKINNNINICLVKSEVKIIDEEILASDFCRRNSIKPIDKMIQDIKKYFNINLTYQNIVVSEDDLFVFIKDELLILKYLNDDNILTKFIPNVIDNYCIINKSDLNKYQSLLDYFEFDLSNFKLKN